MATIKSFTDLQQSKTLAEILPLESADMKWYFWKEEIDAPKLPTFGYSKEAAESYKDTEAVYLPCWSLAALLGLMPNSQNIKIDNVYYSIVSFKHEYGTSSFRTSQYDNPIDAVFKMICWLKENNRL